MGFNELNSVETDIQKDAFAKDFKCLSKLWESLSADNVLNLYQTDYNWLSQVFESVRPASDAIGKLLWITLGAQTTLLIHENIHVGDIHHLEEKTKCYLIGLTVISRSIIEME